MSGSSFAWADTDEEFEKAEKALYYEQLGFDYLYEKYDMNFSRREASKVLNKFRDFLNRKWNFIQTHYDKDADENSPEGLKYKEQKDDYFVQADKFNGMYSALEILKSE